MPPSKRSKLSTDPLDSPSSSSSSHLVTIKQEPEDNIVNYVTESFNSFENFSVNDQPEQDYYENDEYEDYDEEDETSELLEEIQQHKVSKPNQPGKRKRDKYLKYQREDLIAAAELVFEGKMSIFKASKLYGIPKTTLHYFVKSKGENKPVKKRGAEGALAENEEDEILEWLKVASDVGVYRTQEDLLQAAADILKMNKRPGFKNELPSIQWIKRFMTRHPNAVKLKKLTDSIDERKFYTKFHKFLEQNNLLGVLDRPDAFYVMEDTNFELNLRVNNAWNRSLLRKALARKGGDPNELRRKDSVTVTYCFGADGKKLQELVIFNEEFKDIVKVALVDQEIDSKFLFTRTKTGGHTKDSFKCYLQRLDAQLKDVQRPIFIFCSETLPHVGIGLHRWCKEREIFIISFIPNEVSILEECDKGIFGFDNLTWREKIEKFEESKQKINEVEFTRLLKKVNDEFINEAKIYEIFDKISIFPFDSSKIDENLIESEAEDQAVDEKSAERSKGKDQVILHHLSKLKQMNELLKEMLKKKNLNNFIDNARVIEQQINEIEHNL